ncbi:MAG: sigma-70 family RNA polymerase sigma factor [Candidatus Eisenbacteria bacterium]|nr:sigma-70 family RNA polymerase sigma factor [Candidatus Latescibacterota bacterium]MBD3302643.1 sigma-70 family RNA polymerase sigma factor [Candidatus Eisenbacteria bacterium]
MDRTGGLAIARGGTSVDRPTSASEPVLRIEEDRWIEEASRGDLQAFEKLYRTYSGRIYALCLRLAGDAGLAEDLTQDAFVRAWQRIGRFERRSRFFTWLFRLTVNLAIDRIRWETRRSGLESSDEEMERHPAPPRGFTTEGRIDLERAIGALPPGARVVFVLHDVEGYKHEEIAEMTGIAVGTSKAQLHRARRLLRERLQ